MKLLVDNALSPVVAQQLLAEGYEAVHVRELGMASAPDDKLFSYAADHGFVIVSMDTDFGALLALRDSAKPSVVLLRGAVPRAPLAQAAMIAANLQAVGNDLASGAVVVIEPTRVRVRRLPIGG